MEKATLGCRCSHARETLHAVCPKLLKFLFVLRSAYQRHWCSSARNKTIPHSMQKKNLGSKACLLHDCPLLSSKKMFLQYLGDKKRTGQTLYGHFSGFCSLGLLPSWLRCLIRRCLIHKGLIRSYPQLGLGTCPHAPASSSKGTAKPKK